eukprot:11220301-Lingulodinium_polyedra.AAC.1
MADADTTPVSKAKKPRISHAKAELCLNLMKDKLQQEQLNKDLDWIVAHLKKHPEAVPGVKVFLQSSERVALPKTVPRGVRDLGSVPAWLAKKLIGEVLGTATAVNLSKADVPKMLVFLTRQTDKYRVPALQMPLSEFVA